MIQKVVNHNQLYMVMGGIPHYLKEIDPGKSTAQKRGGMNRTKLIQAAKLPNGGSVTKILNDLQLSGFIELYLPFGKNRFVTHQSVNYL